MANKKTRRHGLMKPKVNEIERGYTVVNPDGKRIYLSAHPQGLPREDAEKLSAGLATDSKVVPIDQLG